MAKPITIREEREPTIFNRYALSGARVGLLAVLGVAAVAATSVALGPATPIVGESLAPAISAMVANASGWLFGLGSAAAGFVVGACAYAGGLSGAREVEHNRYAGRTVYPPGLINEGLFHGLMDGALLSAAAITATAIITATVAPALAAASLAFVTGASVIGTAFMGYYQADAQRDLMGKDYLIAQQKLMQGAAPAPAHAPSRTPQITPEELSHLESRQRTGRSGGMSAVERLAAQQHDASLANLERG